MVGMEDASEALASVLSFIQVERDAVPSFLDALHAFADSIDALQVQLAASGVLASSGPKVSCPSFFRNGLPDFLAASLRCTRVSNLYVTCPPHADGVQRTLQLLERDAALVRHVGDFIAEIARWVANGDGWRPSDQDVALYPACEGEQEQAFWQGNQEQASQHLPIYIGTQTALVHPAYLYRLLP